MNKKTIIILGIFFLIIVIIASYYFMKKGILEFNGTGTNGGVSTVHNSINIKGYNIDINAERETSEADRSYFRTSFKTINNDNYECNYYVDFTDIALKSEGINDGINYDIARPEKVVINGKKFEVYLDESHWNATLHYQLPDQKGMLIINVIGGPVFTSEGNQIKTLATVDESVIKSKELAEVMDFTVHK